MGSHDSIVRTGVIMFYMLTGKFPFIEECDYCGERVSTHYRRVEEVPVMHAGVIGDSVWFVLKQKLDKLVKLGMSKACEALLQKMLKIRPAQRISIEQVLKEFEQNPTLQ